MKPLQRYRLVIVNAIVLLTVFASAWGRRLEGATVRQKDFLTTLRLPFRNWKATDVALSAEEQSFLEPDATLIRRYTGAEGAAEIAVIAGHRKRTIHTPGFCMVGGGWETIWQKEAELTIDRQTLPVVRALMSKERQQLLVTYFFTDGSFHTRSLLAFQQEQLWQRLSAQVPLGALVRIMVPTGDNVTPAEQTTSDFARATLPAILQSLRATHLERQ